MADTGPLRELMTEVFDRRMIERIAALYKSVRRLLIGTTNLDAQRPVLTTSKASMACAPWRNR